MGECAVYVAASLQGHPFSDLIWQNSSGMYVEMGKVLLELNENCLQCGFCGEGFALNERNRPSSL
jgi:hypothetical protein